MKYKDLSIEAKQVALEHHSNNAADYEWDEDIKEYWVEKLEGLGISTSVNDIKWTGFWSQGDGCSFTGDINLRVFLESHKDIVNHNAELYLTTIPFDGVARCYYYPKLTRNRHQYYHESTISLDCDEIDCYTEDEDEMYGLWTDVEGDIIEQCRSYMKDIYRALSEEYEYITGEEALIERDADYAEDGEETICFGEFL
jgi:hypothetical protein